MSILTFFHCHWNQALKNIILVLVIFQTVCNWIFSRVAVKELFIDTYDSIRQWTVRSGRDRYVSLLTSIYYLHRVGVPILLFGSVLIFPRSLTCNVEGLSFRSAENLCIMIRIGFIENNTRREFLDKNFLSNLSSIN